MVVHNCQEIPLSVRKESEMPSNVLQIHRLAHCLPQTHMNLLLFPFWNSFRDMSFPMFVYIFPVPENRDLKLCCIKMDMNFVWWHLRMTLIQSKLTEAFLKVWKVKGSPSITMTHEIALKQGPAVYPIRRVECKSFIILAGNPSLMKDNVFSGLYRKRFSLD